jgi:hypothetical protein
MDVAGPGRRAFDFPLYVVGRLADGWKVELEQLVYVSQATQPLSPKALRELIARSAARNASVQVTGLLLYSRGHFMQLLEGPPAAVGKLYDTIRVDSRHAAVRRLSCKPVWGRLFAKWHMGLLDTSTVAGPDYRRLHAVLEQAMPHQDLPHGAEAGLALLREFRRQMPTRRSA